MTCAKKGVDRLAAVYRRTYGRAALTVLAAALERFSRRGCSEHRCARYLLRGSIRRQTVLG